jgi:hypothetical protein
MKDTSYERCLVPLIVPARPADHNKVKRAKIVFEIFLTGLFCLCLFQAGAQPLVQPGRNLTYVPFVTGIRAEVRGNMIRLSWVDSPDIRGSVYIYRSRTPFDTANSHRRIQPIEIPYGIQSYIDEVESDSNWYYFIAPSDNEGRRYDIMIPSGNMVSVSLGRPEGAVSGDESDSLLRREEVWHGITNLQAAVRGDGVEISFNLNDGSRIPVLYRSVSPITSSRNILNAAIVRSDISSPYMDYPVPGIAYYYALITEDELFSGNMEILPGANATQYPVEIPSGYRIGLRSSTELRPMPLPLISATSISPMGSGISPGTPLSPAVERAISGINASPNFSKTAFKAPRIFRGDLEVPSGGGEEYLLRTIAQGPFLQRNWEEVGENLTEFLSLPRSSSVENRARFYLGQTHYYKGNYREALFEFLLIRDEFPAESNEWVQAVLSLMIKKP